MGAVRTLASLARAAREQVGIRVRQPLQTLRIAVPSGVRGPEFDALLPLLAQEVNVRAVELVGAETDLVTLSGKANYRSLGQRYGRETPIAAKAVSQLDPEQLRALESGATIEFDHDGRRWEYYPEDVTVVREVATDWVVESAGPYIAAINPKITPALQREGLARELVNRVQRLRKDAGYAYTTRILLAVDGSEEVQSAVRAHRDLIQGETLARHLELGPASGPTDRVEQATIDNHAVTIAIGQVAEQAPAANP
jgi:isoleucyl-tRNA synthetase